jgi:hypothetical protein
VRGWKGCPIPWDDIERACARQGRIARDVAAYIRAERGDIYFSTQGMDVDAEVVLGFAPPRKGTWQIKLADHTSAILFN